MTTPVIDRLFAKVQWPTSFTACWVWTANRDPSGYGQIRMGSRTDGSSHMAKAHRVAYELARGSIPEGQEIDHLCRNRACVNPVHLEAVPKAVNIRRGVSFSATNAEKVECPSGHPYDAANTYLWRGWRTCRTCRKSRKQAVA